MFTGHESISCSYFGVADCPFAGWLVCLLAVFAVCCVCGVIMALSSAEA